MQHSYTSPHAYFNRRPSIEEQREKLADQEHEFYQLKADVEARHQKEIEKHFQSNKQHPDFNRQETLTEQIKKLHCTSSPTNNLRHLYSDLQFQQQGLKQNDGDLMETHFKPPAGPDMSYLYPHLAKQKEEK